MSESSPPCRVAIRLEYRGDRYHGWAFQPSIPTVAGEVEKALARIDPIRPKVKGASRTDKGVHSAGQVVAFTPSRKLPTGQWGRALNALLPEDIAVTATASVPLSFEPRFESVRKHYRYLISLNRARNPLVSPYCWELGSRWRGGDKARFVDLELMRRASRQMIGTHSFHAFRQAEDEHENTIRTLYRLSISEDFLFGQPMLRIDVTGDAFMKNMVRIIAGTLMEVAVGRMLPEAIAVLLSHQGTRAGGGPTAPAQGLCLMGIELGRRSLPPEWIEVHSVPDNVRPT